MDSSTVLVLADPTDPLLGMLDALPDAVRIAAGNRVEAFADAAPHAGVILNWTNNRELLRQVEPRASAVAVMLKSYDGYSTNLPLSDLDRDDVFIAHTWNGKPLSREHGGPVRLVVPHLYFWKSAKWLRHISFLDRDQPGYWEARGYHMRGDPWKEQRYG